MVFLKHLKNLEKFEHKKMYENKFLKLPIYKVHPITLENIQIESHFDAFQN